MASRWEVELKFHVTDADALQQGLTQLGFFAHGSEMHCDTYFRHPCRDFRESDEAFRVRQVDSAAQVTYKGPRASAKVKTRPEIELALEANELDAWKEMLQHLGFRPLPPVRKKRYLFCPPAQKPIYEGFSVTLDQVEQLGTFAEVELIVEAAERLAEAQHRVEELSKRLGLSHEQPRSYLSQLLEKLGVE